MITQKNFFIDTSEDVDLINVIHEVKGVVREAGVQQGLVTLVSPLAMASFVILDSREEAPEKFKKELEEFLKGDEGDEDSEDLDSPPPKKKGMGRVRPIEKRSSVVAATMTKGLFMSLMGRSLSVPLVKGELSLDPWEKIYLLDLSPEGRRREFLIQVVGEGDQAGGRQPTVHPGGQGGVTVKV